VTRALPDAGYVIQPAADCVVLGPQDFGSPGLRAVEFVGPYVEIQALGPLLTVHDSTVEARMGIGHHPHRYNERIFYLLSGELDHDDARNGIKGHMGTGDVGLFTEGRRGMVHSEWNNGDVDTRALMFVYATDPMPEETAFTTLPSADAPRYEEAAGVSTKEMVGRRSPLEIHGDIRLFTDTSLNRDATLTLSLAEGEGAFLLVLDGALRLDDNGVEAGTGVLFPPAAGAREYRLRADAAARLLRIVHGTGYGLRLRRDGLAE
jgi:redox-sensitive bicupin YhaK (pirin superfamily)